MLASGRPVALPEVATSSAGLQALATLTASVPDPDARARAFASAAAALRRGTVAQAAAAFSQVVDAGGSAPLVPTTEQQVFQATRGDVRPPMVAVRPAGARSSLDYPVVRVDTEEREAGVDAAAVEGVVRLLETQGRAAAVVDGFRRPPGPGNGPAPGLAAAGEAGVVPVARWSDAEVLLQQLAELGRPSRLLLVLDASASMRAVTVTGATRAQVAQDAVARVVESLPETDAAGLWFFAAGVGTGPDGAALDHVEVVPVRAVDPTAAGLEQRAALLAGTAQLTGRLTPGGTGLLDTVLASVRTVREGYDPAAVNTVVLLTDGGQGDPGGLGLDELVATLAAENGRASRACRRGGGHRRRRPRRAPGRRGRNGRCRVPRRAARGPPARAG